MKPLEFSITCVLPHGIHARPASCIEEVARRFDSSIVVTNNRTGVSADAKSVVMLVGADIRHGDACQFAIEGTDQDEVYQAVNHFVHDIFPTCDEPLPEPPRAAAGPRLPVSLNRCAAQVLAGTPASPGIGRGRAVFVDMRDLAAGVAPGPAGTPEHEWNMLQSAASAVRSSLERRLLQPLHSEESTVVRAHLSILRDPSIDSAMRQLVFANGASSTEAVRGAYEHCAAIFAASGSRIAQERLIDIKDICRGLLDHLRGGAPEAADVAAPLAEESVLIAGNLTPMQFIAMNHTLVRGLVFAHGGATSHTAILARSRGIPTLIGVTDIHSGVRPGQDIIVDADSGFVVTEITEPVSRYYARESATRLRRRERLRTTMHGPAHTKDGKRIEVAATIAWAQDAAIENGADGIGLFRTEMIFMGRESAPGEDEQVDAYGAVVKAAAGRPVIFRTLDIGGDKPLPYLHVPAERNPFLGWRAVRMYPAFAALIETQLRAIVRVAAAGNVKILIPMVGALDEFEYVRNLTGRIVDSLQPSVNRKSRNVPEIGIMVEIPSPAFSIGQFCPRVDFFSIGTNDLAQYFLAVDRENEKVSHLCDVRTPSFIRLLALVSAQAHAGGRWIGMCGEMAGESRCLRLLVGLGLDEISIVAHSIPHTKAAISSLDSTECANLVKDAVQCDTVEQVNGLLEGFGGGMARIAVLDSGIIMTQSDVRTKEEAIKELADLLCIAGRTQHPGLIEEAVWQRESVYPTALGYGFAVPHCKSDLVLANSVALVKPAAPVNWDCGGTQVNVIILLAVRASDAHTDHMKIFSALARKIMHKEFRDRLLFENDPEAIRLFLLNELALPSI